jgi:hypothetical protein
MSTPEISSLLEQVADTIGEIDRACNTLLNGIEHGLVNVKREFRDRVYQETGKKLKEEQLIAWLVRKKLISAGWHVDWESPYPTNVDRECDLVVGLKGSSKLWLELKLAWKAWFNCASQPRYSNGVYHSYLQGSNRSHSFRQDFEKLERGSWPLGDCRAICLIGTDYVKAPMGQEVAAVVESVRQHGFHWEAATERHWSDRRCSDFRINVWSWVLLPSAKH